MSSEDLDEGDLERGDLPVHEDARQVKLHLRRNKSKFDGGQISDTPTTGSRIQ